VQELICPVCNNKSPKHIYKKIFGNRDILRCRYCSLYFLWPKLTSDKDKEFYAREYYNSWAQKELGEEGLRQMKQDTFNLLLNIVTRYKKSGTLLDIGCAFGHLLDAAEKRGWDAYGVEMSEYAAQEAAKKAGSGKIWTGNFLELPLPVNNFDVITMVDLIEHVYDLVAVLDQCRKILKEEGLLVIITPNTDSFSRKLLGRSWPQFKEEHVAYLSKRSVRELLHRSNFKLLLMANFKKALNFYYIRSQFNAYEGRLLIFFINALDFLMPVWLKKINFFIPQGEMLIIARKG